MKIVVAIILFVSTQAYGMLTNAYTGQYMTPTRTFDCGGFVFSKNSVNRSYFGNISEAEPESADKLRMNLIVSSKKLKGIPLEEGEAFTPLSEIKFKKNDQRSVYLVLKFDSDDEVDLIINSPKTKVNMITRSEDWNNVVNYKDIGEENSTITLKPLPGRNGKGFALVLIVNDLEDDYSLRIPDAYRSVKVYF